MTDVINFDLHLMTDLNAVPKGRIYKTRLYIVTSKMTLLRRYMSTNGNLQALNSRWHHESKKVHVEQNKIP